MLQSSRTWPTILTNTMAVVQLKFDQKGKYSYSAIANINQSHKQQLIEIHSPITNGHATYANNNESHNGEQKNDLITNNAKSEVVSPTNGRQYNGVNHSSSNNCTSPSKNGKVCLCELKFREKRKRSESIKVENWDFIYKEKAFRTNIDPPLCDDHNALPKSPCDHGLTCRTYLSGLGAQKLDTIRRHYYPEGGYGFIIVMVSFIVATIVHGFQLSSVFFLLPVQDKFRVNEVECLGE